MMKKRTRSQGASAPDARAGTASAGQIARRTKQSDRCKKLWERAVTARNSERSNDKKNYDGNHVLSALQYAFEQIGDSRFEECIAAICEYDMGRGWKRGAKSARHKRFGHYLDAYIAQVDFLITRGWHQSKIDNPRARNDPPKRESRGPRLRVESVREACELIVAESAIPGTSFERVADELREHYSRWRSGNSQISPVLRGLRRSPRLTG